MQITIHPFWKLRNEMDQLLTGFLGSAFNGFSSKMEGDQPAVNVWDQGEDLMLEMELPGVKSDQIDISVVGEQATIKVERPNSEQEGVTYHRRERPAGSFTRVLSLPCTVYSENVEADLQNGVLTLRLPKAEAAKPRKINVTST